MRVFVIHPGATFSTHDVYSGLVWGLRQNGVEVIEYRLDKALQVSGALIHAAVSGDALEEAVDVFGLASSEAIAAAVHFEPDAVIVVSGGNFPLMRAIGLRNLSAQRRVPFPVALLDTEAPYVTGAMQRAASRYDVLFTNEKLAVPRFQHPNAHYLPHAYRPDVHTPGAAEMELMSDVLFVGTAFPERQDLFYGKLDESGTRQGGPDWGHLKFLCLGALWEGMTDIAQTISPEGIVDNPDTVRYYRSAGICLNHHRTSRVFGSGEHIDAAEAYSLGPRAYEIAAVGAFQLSDNSRPELTELFGDSVPTYQAGNSLSLSRQIHYWMQHPDQRKACAEEARTRVAPHTWDRRAADVLTVLEAARDDLKSRHRRKRRRVPIQPPGTFVNLSKRTEAPHGDQTRQERRPVLGAEHSSPHRRNS